MRQFLSIISLFVCQHTYGQLPDTSDIFDIDSNYYLILKPDVEKKINRTIAPIVKRKLHEFKIRNENELNSLSSRLRQDEVAFAEDTIRIKEFLAEYEGAYSFATTIMGMNWGESKRLDAYDKLLNNYYKKALSVLKPDMRNKLVQSQKRWLDYYLKEKNFIYELNDFGNHNSSLYNWGYYFEMMEKRVLFLKDIYHQVFHGSNTYLE